MNRLWLKMSLKDAIATPIVFVNSKNNVIFEPEFDKVKKKNLITGLILEVLKFGFHGVNVCSPCPQSVIEGLKALGHKVEDWKYFFNVVNGLEKEDGCIEAVADQRKKGQPAGY